LSLLRDVQTSCGVHPPSCSLDTSGSCPGVQRLGWEADQSTAYNAEVMNKRSCNAISLYTFMPCSGTTLPFPLVADEQRTDAMEQCDYCKRCTWHARGSKRWLWTALGMMLWQLPSISI